MTGEQEQEGRGWTVLWEAGLLMAILTLGFWLRWFYARDVSFFVDEYLTARAASRILEQGIPLLPSGNFYSHGLLLSYVEAALVGLGAADEWMMRLPVVLLSTASVFLTWWFGQRLFSPAAALVAAALLALNPEAILWGGRVRMYAPLQFFVLLATVVFYFWVVRERDRPLYPLLFVLAYWGSLFSHAEAMLLLPIWGLWALLQRGWRWCLRPLNLVAFGLSGLSIAVEIVLRRMGPPVQARVSAGVFEPLTREYLGAGLDWPGVQKVVEPLFLTPVTLPISLLVLAGLGYLLAARLLRPSLVPRKEGRALAYLYALLLPVLFLLLFVVDPSWKSPRYGLMLLPHYYLIGGAVLSGIGRWLVARLPSRWPGQAILLARWVGISAVVGLIGAASWQPALAATRESVPSYDRAFAYVAEHQQPGDVVVTFLCPAAFFHLGRCDYLAVPVDFSGFATEKDGRWVSGWDEVPIIDSAEGLGEVLGQHPRVWFVVDEGRFGRRYDEDFQQTVLNGMQLVVADREVLVFFSAGAPR